MKEIALKSDVIFKGKILKVKVDKVKLPNGKESTREVVEHPGAVVVVPMIGDKVIMVEQYRYPIGRTLLELPAGKLDPGETPEECARRELEEETGYRAGRITYLGKIYTSPGFSSEIVHIFLAEDLKEGANKTDEDEFLDVVKKDFKNVVKECLEGKIEDAKTVVAVLRVWGMKGVDPYETHRQREGK